MFKRNIALGLAAILLVSGINMPVKAETLVKDNAENQAYVLQAESEVDVDEDFPYVENVETKNVDLTDELSVPSTEPEEASESSVPSSEPAEASESSASSTEPEEASESSAPLAEPTEAPSAPSAEPTETPAAPMTTPTSSAQPALNEAVVQKPAILAENGFAYTVTVEEPVDNTIKASTAMHFASSSDYSGLRFQYRFSEKSDMTSYSTVYGSGTWSSGTGEIDVVYKLSGEYKPNTTYFIALYEYSSTDGWVQVSDIVSVTTKEEAECEIRIVPGDVGAGTISYGLESINISDKLQNLSLRIYYSKENDFDVRSMNYFNEYMYKNDDGQFYSKKIKKYGFEPDTTYYLKAFKYSGGQSKYIPVSDVTEITTAVDEIYPDDTFKDPIVFEAVRKEVGGDLSQITLSKLERVTQLDLYSANSAVTSLEGIEKLVNLEKIVAFYNDIEDLTPISKLSKLKSADFRDNKIKNIPDLSALVNLEEINASYNDIEDLTPISKLSKLKSANFYDNKIKNIPDLSALGSLTSFDLRWNYIQTDELTNTNTNIPEYFRNDSKWISDTTSTQRTSEDMTFKVAPVYYISQGTSQFQAEIGNIRGSKKYTLSILEGEKVIADKIEPDSDYDHYYKYYDTMTEGFYIADIGLMEGVHDLTFVVYADDVEVKRSTASVEYIDSVVYKPYSGYDTFGEDVTYTYFAGYLYGSADNVTAVELYGPDGNIAASEQVSMKAYNSIDDRYYGLFEHTHIRTYHTSVFFDVGFDKKLKVGKYSAKFISDDGNAIEIPDFFEVTGKPMIDSLSMSSDYPNNSGNPQIYVSVSGNLDFNKIYPVIRTDEGSVITELKDMKITGAKSAVYMIENTSELELNRDMVIAIEKKDASYEIYNHDYSKQVTLFDYANIYYSEHVPYTNTIKLFMENVDDGEYEWYLYTDYNYKTLYAKSTASVHDGLAYVTFESTDAGSDLFDRSNYYLKAQVKMRGETYTVSKHIYNINSIPSKELSLNLAELSSVLTAKGTKLSGTVYKGAFGENAVLRAELYGDDNVKILDITDVKKSASTVMSSNGIEYDAWNITVDIPAFEAASGKKYQLTVYADDTAIGTSNLYSVAPNKLSYNYFYVDTYSPADKTMKLDIRGYFPADIDYSKLTINLNTEESDKYIGTLTVKEITGIRDNEGDTNDYVYALMDTSLLPEDIADYVNLRAYVYYNGEPVDYMYYGNSYTRTVSFEPRDEKSYISLHSKSQGPYKGCCDGVYTYGANPVTVSIYYPYAANPLVSFTLTGEDGRQQLNYFTEDQFEGVTVNSYENKYYILLTDASGAYLRSRTGYINAKATSTTEPTATPTTEPTATPTVAPTTEPTPTAESTYNAKGLVERFYTELLGRDGEADGIEGWTEQLETEALSAIFVGYLYVDGDEFKGLNLNNDEYLERLYKTFMNRPSDAGGKAYWLERLDAGFTRDYIYLNFAVLPEFTEICDKSHIRRGETDEIGKLKEASEAYANKNLKVSQYVTRCYTKVLNRPADAEGVEFWCGQIITKAIEAKTAAEAYVLSEEFASRNTTDAEYVEVLYQTFFGRAGDEGGTGYWLGQLGTKAMSREDVLHAFSATPEFAEILAGFGL